MPESLRYDLHTHTHYSDGLLTPTELVARAAARGVRVLALTDHDVTDGLPEAESAAQGLGLGFVPGVEVSVTWGSQTVHVVGLRIDRANADLQAGLQRLRDFRVWRAEEIGRRLASAGIEDASAGARRHAQRGLVSRTHFAHYLVESGHARDVRSVFKKFLVRGKPGHVPGDWASLPEAVGWIRAAGGQAVLAHPARYKITATRLRKLLGEFRDCGGEAIEVVSGSHSRDDMYRFAEISRHFGLLASAGSDFHGPAEGYRDLGPLPALPEGCVPVWHEWPAAPEAVARLPVDTHVVG